jgi:hypothetical protein
MPKAAALSLVARPKARSFKLEYKMAAKKPMKKPVKRVRRFQEGGEAALKAEGLAASNKDAPLGFFDSLRRLGQGNIDAEGSEAYNRYGAGRGRMERDAKSEAAANRMVDEARSAKGISKYQESVDQDEADRGADMRNYEMMQRGRAEGERNEKAYKAPSPVAQAQVAAILAAKPSRTSSGTTTGDLARIDRKVPSGPTPTRAPGGAMKRGALSNEAPAASSSAAAPAAKPAATSAATTREERQARIDQAFKPPSDEQIQAGLEAGTLGAGFTLKKVADFAKNLANRKSAMKDRLRLDRPGTVSGEGFVMRDGKMVKDIATKAPPKALSGPRKDDITDVTPKNMDSQSLRAAARRGDEDAKSERFVRGLKEQGIVMKKGGTAKKMASGGSVKSSVSTASKRGDGIALRGKTRGKIY